MTWVLAIVALVTAAYFLWRNFQDYVLLWSHSFGYRRMRVHWYNGTPYAIDGDSAVKLLRGGKVDSKVSVYEKWKPLNAAMKRYYLSHGKYHNYTKKECVSWIFCSFGTAVVAALYGYVFFVTFFQW